MLNYAIIDKISNIWKTISTTICTIYIKNEKNNNGTRYKEIPKGAMFEKNDKKKRNAINNNAWVHNKEI